MYKKITLFGGLNELRIIAALLVLLHHSETIRKKNELFNFEWWSLFKNGGNAVSFFFVLSGFLITYLLLKEKKTTSTISIKQFYLKRVRRIWPLYFLLVFIGSIVLPFVINFLNIDYDMPYTFIDTWHYFLLFVPGLVTFYYGHHLLEPLWSIGVEEIFYLIWAPLFKFINKNITLLLFTIIGLKVLGNIYFTTQLTDVSVWNYIFKTFNIEAMAIGGLGAKWLYDSDKKLSTLPLFLKPVQYFVLFVVVVHLIFDQNITWGLWSAIFHTPIISNLIIYFLYLYLIINVSVVENSIIPLRNRVLSKLGEISYGVYMYHMLVIFSVILFFKKYLLKLSPFLSTSIFYLLVIGGTIIIAFISHKYYEKLFMKSKLIDTTKKRSDLNYR